MKTVCKETCRNLEYGEHSKVCRDSDQVSEEDNPIREIGLVAIKSLSDRGGFDGWWSNVTEFHEEIMIDIGMAVMKNLTTDE